MGAGQRPRKPRVNFLTLQNGMMPTRKIRNNMPSLFYTISYIYSSIAQNWNKELFALSINLTLFTGKKCYSTGWKASINMEHLFHM